MMPPEPERSWTEQPGSDGEWLSVDVLGPGSTIVDANALAEQKLLTAVRSAATDVSASGSVFTLRPYQQEACAAVFEAWSLGKKAPVIIGGTGFGKTLVAAEIMRRSLHATRGRAVFMAHRTELLDQTIAIVKVIAPRCTVGLLQASSRQDDRMITVASVDTLKGQERLDSLLSHGAPALLVIDECHHATAAKYRTVIDKLREANPNLLVLGLTGTPGRADGTGLDEVFDGVAYEKNILQLIELGALVPPTGVAVKIDVRLEDVASENGDFVKASLSKVINTPAVRRTCVEAWQQHGHDKKMIVFCSDVQHARDLAAEFNDAGYPAAAIDGSMKKNERKALYTRFRSGEIKLLCSVEVLTEGFDEPSVEGILFARPTQSQGLYLQCLGRGLRLFPMKTECLVIDCVGNGDQHATVQLASLAGLQPISPEEPKFDEKEDAEEEGDPEAFVENVEARALDFRLRSRKNKYAWRQTTFGWTLQIPRIGYFLVAWHDNEHTLATVRFHDMRDGRRDKPPIAVVSQPVEFQMAYGLVEGEVERLVSARSAKARSKEKEAPEETPPFAFLLDDGLEEDIWVAEQTLVNEAGWRDKPMTLRQREHLLKLGLKEASLPPTAGEANDLITVMMVERDVKKREPATDKQLWYLRIHKLPHDETITKSAAARLIYPHRREMEERKRRAEREG